MKTIYALILFLLCIPRLYSQIPNAGFESFYIQSNGGWSPNEWFATTGLYGSVSQSSPGHNGSGYAVALNLGNLTAANGGVSQITVGSITYPGMVIDFNRPINLTGYVKGGGLKVTVKIYKQGANTVTGAGLIGQGSNTVSGNDWTQFTIPISYTTQDLGRIVIIELRNNGGSNSSVLVDDLNLNLNTTATDEIADDAVFNISPNPAVSNIDLVVNSSAVGSNYYILDQLGKIVTYGTAKNEFSNIDISNLKNGLYYFQIIGNRSRILKLIKE
jgi:hypothetical protein